MDSPEVIAGASLKSNVIEKRPTFNLRMAGLFSFADYFTNIMTREMMIAIRVPKAIMSESAS